MPAAWWAFYFGIYGELRTVLLQSKKGIASLFRLLAALKASFQVASFDSTGEVSENEKVFTFFRERAEERFTLVERDIMSGDNNSRRFGEAKKGNGSSLTPLSERKSKALSLSDVPHIPAHIQPSSTS